MIHQFQLKEVVVIASDEIASLCLFHMKFVSFHTLKLTKHTHVESLNLKPTVRLKSSEENFK